MNRTEDDFGYAGSAATVLMLGFGGVIGLDLTGI
jgi:hypothetical protein